MRCTFVTLFSRNTFAPAHELLLAAHAEPEQVESHRNLDDDLLLVRSEGRRELASVATDLPRDLNLDSRLFLSGHLRPNVRRGLCDSFSV